CIRNKIDLLNAYFLTNEFNILCITEHWLQVNELPFIIDLSEYCDDLISEVTGIIVYEYKLIILTIYRSQRGDIKRFFENLALVLNYICTYKLDVIIYGDFNIDLMKKISHSSHLCNIFKSHGCFQTIFEPTRNDSCLDNLFTTLPVQKHFTRTFFPALSDHICITINVKVNKQTDNLNVEYIYSPIRDFNEFQMCIFKQLVSNIDWNYIFNVYNLNTLTTFDIFFTHFYEIYCKCFPLNLKKKYVYPSLKY
ncbi:hypothetical protein C0J52_05632, partial [Blattella germanica]